MPGLHGICGCAGSFVAIEQGGYDARGDFAGAGRVAANEPFPKMDRGKEN